MLLAPGKEFIDADGCHLQPGQAPICVLAQDLLYRPVVGGVVGGVAGWALLGQFRPAGQRRSILPIRDHANASTADSPDRAELSGGVAAIE